MKFQIFLKSLSSTVTGGDDDWLELVVSPNKLGLLIVISAAANGRSRMSRTSISTLSKSDSIDRLNLLFAS